MIIPSCKHTQNSCFCIIGWVDLTWVDMRFISISLEYFWYSRAHRGFQFVRKPETQERFEIKHIMWTNDRVTFSRQKIKDENDNVLLCGFCNIILFLSLSLSSNISWVIIPKRLCKILRKRQRKIMFILPLRIKIFFANQKSHHFICLFTQEIYFLFCVTKA